MRISIVNGAETLATTKTERNRLHDAVTVCRQFERHGTSPMADAATAAMEALGDVLRLIAEAEKAGVAAAKVPE